MILTLLAWCRRLAAAEYWRLRCGRAEAALEAEMWRNREREDYYVSAAVMGGRGMVGIQPRGGPALQPSPQRVLVAPDIKFSGIDRMEFEAEWLPQGLAQGVSRQKIETDFAAELERRRSPLNDSAYN